MQALCYEVVNLGAMKEVIRVAQRWTPCLVFCAGVIGRGRKVGLIHNESPNTGHKKNKGEGRG